MRYLSVIAMVLISSLTLEAGELDLALKRFAELKTKSQGITKTSSEQDVISIFGEPQHKGNGGWGRFDTKVWTYLNYLDDSHHYEFKITLDPKEGCSFSATHLTRQEIEKKPLLVTTGTVLRSYPYEKNLRFLCDIQIKDGERESSTTVAVENLNRVKGEPKPGAKIRIEHRGIDGLFFFFGSYTLSLESITFTNATSPTP
jgi:hypothetical protein